jgi:hypothetical protein
LKDTVILSIQQLTRPKKRKQPCNRNRKMFHNLQVQHKLNKVHRK